MRVVISSGHGKYVRGASGYIDEVDEARKVVERTAQIMRDTRIEATTYNDDVSRSQSENLHRIVDFHNSRERDLDISVHFNSYETTSKPMGCEVLYVSNAGLEKAGQVVNAICSLSKLKNRGAKKRTDLYFLNNTEKPAILIEVCFVDSRTDVDIYEDRFEEICTAIATAVAGEAPSTPEAEFYTIGKCSWFGGPKDTGVAPNEGLAFISRIEDAPQLFLPYQPSGTTGLARRLNPYVHFVACRWDYDVTPKEVLRSGAVAWVRSTRTGIGMKAFPADWGPNETTGRVADLSAGLMEDLGITTDDEVEVIFPYL